MRGLVIEDDPKIARFLVRGLEADGWTVEDCAEGAQALERLSCDRFDLVLLDLMLPDEDGFELLRRIRATDSSTPVFIVSARDSVEDRVQGLDLGADEFIGKPFSFVELQARVRAFFRREDRRSAARIVSAAGLELDRVDRRVSREGRSESLTAREFQLLDYFMSNPGQPLTRAMLADRVWGYQFDTGTNVVDVYVNYLRKKLQRLGADPIRTQRGVGYAFDSDNGTHGAQPE